ERFYELEGLAAYLSVISISFILSGLSIVPLGLLQRKLLFRQLASINLVAAAFAGATAILMAISGWGVWSLIASQLLNGLVILIGIWFTSRWIPDLILSLPAIRPLWLF